MNKLHKRRLIFVITSAIIVSIAMSLILYALKQNINVFVTPKQIANTHLPPNYHFRIGGLVKEHSLVRNKKDLQVDFIVTDLKKELRVHFNGVLPDLFREGKGVIAEGSMNTKGVFVATQILAKHDENYLPKNVYQSLREKS